MKASLIGEQAACPSHLSAALSVLQMAEQENFSDIDTHPGNSKEAFNGVCFSENKTAHCCFVCTLTGRSESSAELSSFSDSGRV